MVNNINNNNFTCDLPVRTLCIKNIFGGSEKIISVGINIEGRVTVVYV